MYLLDTPVLSHDENHYFLVILVIGIHFIMLKKALKVQRSSKLEILSDLDC